MADLAALQTKLEALGWLAAGLEQHRVTVCVAVELLHRGLLDSRAAAGADVAAGGAEPLKAGEAGLQQTHEEHGTLTPQARQQHVETRVWRHHHEEKHKAESDFAARARVHKTAVSSEVLSRVIKNGD